MLDTIVSVSLGTNGRPEKSGPAQSFLATLKRELVEDTTYPTREAARADLFHYIEGFYRQRRRHSALGYLTPAQKAATFHHTNATA